MTRRSLLHVLRERHEELVDRAARPRMRSDCKDGPRPCPWFSCRHHLGLNVHPPSGRLTQHLDPEALDGKETCSLDVVDANPAGVTLLRIGKLFGVTEMRACQMVLEGLASAKRAARHLVEDGPLLVEKQPAREVWAQLVLESRRPAPWVAVCKHASREPIRCRSGRILAHRCRGCLAVYACKPVRRIRIKRRVEARGGLLWPKGAIANG